MARAIAGTATANSSSTVAPTNSACTGAAAETRVSAAPETCVSAASAATGINGSSKQAKRHDRETDKR
jgi:hypothetical protein